MRALPILTAHPEEVPILDSPSDEDADVLARGTLQEGARVSGMQKYRVQSA